MAVVSELVLPGQDLTAMVEEHLEQLRGLAKRSVRLGYGLRHDAVAGRFVATVAGPLQFAPPGRFWVHCRRSRYVACVGDLVLGVVVAKAGDAYRLDIGAYQEATLQATEGFAAASRRNRPNVPIGGVLFCRVLTADRELEGPEVTCVGEDATGAAPEALGYLKPTEATCSFETLTIGYTLDLQRSDNPTLPAFGRHFPFEIVVGANGRFLLTTGDGRLTWLLGRAIVDAEGGWDASRVAIECTKITELLHKDKSA
jgi:exosome complex component RRP40